MDQDSLRNLARAIPKLTEKSGPKTDDELWFWIKDNIGVEIPRVAVCSDHDAPFKFLADLYFGRVHSAILMANRGGAKTFMTAILHLLNCKFKPGIETCTVGAIEKQAERAYSHVRKFIYDENGDPDPDILQSKMKETSFRNGSTIEIIAGTRAGVNGPHPQLVHIDEVELMDEDIYDEAMQMAKSKKWKNVVFPAQNVITSTRKTGTGMMQSLIDDISAAENNGKEPPYRLYKYCVAETTSNQDHWCQCAHPELPEEKRCPCDRVLGKAVDEDGHRLTLANICRGRFAKSHGFTPLDDLINTFAKSSGSVWDAQQECRKPSTEGMIVPTFQIERHGIRHYEPDPGNGYIFMALDPGGTNPHAVSWYQLLEYEVEAEGYDGSPKRLKEGTLVCFDEIYVADVGNNKVADMIVEHERAWRRLFPRFNVHSRFVDPQAKAARMDLIAHIPPLQSTWSTTREFEEHVKDVREFVDPELFAVDLDRCEMFVEEIQSWRRNKFGKQIDVFNHQMSCFRYAAANIKVILRLEDRRGAIPMALDRGVSITKSSTNTTGSPVAFRSHKTKKRRPELWRARFGLTNDG